MWLMSGWASGGETLLKCSSLIPLERECYEREVQPYRKTDYKSIIYNTELQMIKVHINNTNHITIANIYIPPRDSTSTHYKIDDTAIQHCMQHITNIPHSTHGDVNAHSTLWHSYTDLLLLVVSLHFSHPLFDTFLCRFIVMYQIYI